MKKLILLSVTATSLMFAQGNGSLENIDLKDYKVVDSQSTNAYLNGGLTVEGGNQDQTSYNASVGAKLDMSYSTAPYTWDLKAGANADWDRGANKGDKTQNSYNAGLRSNFSKYFNNDDTWFGYGDLNLGYRKSATADKADDPFAKVGIGAGYGRVYNATPLAKAIRVAEDLVKYKLVDPNISSEALMALAKVIDKENDFESKYGSDDYKKHWYAAMEEVLKANGAVSNEGLGAFGIIRISEILEDENIYARKHGWRVKAGLGQIISNWSGEDEDPTFDAGFEYYLPIGHKGQLNEELTFSKTLNNPDYLVTNDLSYTYEISDKIDWRNAWLLNHYHYDEAENVTVNTLSSRFSYDLANKLDYFVDVSASKTSGGASETEDWDTKLMTGIEYRIK